MKWSNANNWFRYRYHDIFIWHRNVPILLPYHHIPRWLHHVTLVIYTNVTFDISSWGQHWKKIGGVKMFWNTFSQFTLPVSSDLQVSFSCLWHDRKWWLRRWDHTQHWDVGGDDGDVIWCPGGGWQHKVKCHCHGCHPGHQQYVIHIIISLTSQSSGQLWQDTSADMAHELFYYICQILSIDNLSISKPFQQKLFFSFFLPVIVFVDAKLIFSHETRYLWVLMFGNKTPS